MANGRPATNGSVQTAFHQQSISGQSIAKKEVKKPWQVALANEVPLMMFTLEMCNGTEVSYAYSDLRETRLLSNDYLQLGLWGYEKYLITIEGKDLKELAACIRKGTVKSIRELGLRTFDHPADLPAIDKIDVQTLTGPAY